MLLSVLEAVPKFTGVSEENHVHTTLSETRSRARYPVFIMGGIGRGVFQDGAPIFDTKNCAMRVQNVTPTIRRCDLPSRFCYHIKIIRLCGLVSV